MPGQETALLCDYRDALERGVAAPLLTRAEILVELLRIQQRINIEQGRALEALAERVRALEAKSWGVEGG